jgi:uncharacterized protein YdeI (YjbR/CyaY-like superfamily)
VTARPTLTVATPAEWRAWLQRNHRTASEIWLVYFKKRSGRTGIEYESSVEEALCCGWIDSLVRRLDDERYARKFTPRSDTRKWSETNRRRVARLIREGRMTQAGLDKIGYPDPQAPPPEAPRPSRRKAVELPRFMEQAFRANRRAWDTFRQLAPTYRRHYVGWVSSAKREDTRRRRLAEAIRHLERGEKLPLK